MSTESGEGSFGRWAKTHCLLNQSIRHGMFGFIGTPKTTNEIYIKLPCKICLPYLIKSIPSPISIQQGQQNVVLQISKNSKNVCQSARKLLLRILRSFECVGLIQSFHGCYQQCTTLPLLVRLFGINNELQFVIVCLKADFEKSTAYFISTLILNSQYGFVGLSLLKVT